jgi:hypothetical protein
MIIGSGDIPKLLSGLKTKGYRELWKKFIDDTPVYYNALASPIDALRTGAILENNYLQTLSEDYFTQVKCTFDEMNVFVCSLDFAKYSGGVVSEFEELKTIFLPDFIDIIKPLSKESEKQQVKVLKSKFKNNYNQIQDQLMCAELDEARLVFLSVDSYDDEINKQRVIEENDVVKFRITRDDETINFIKQRGKIFQQVKDHFNEFSK